jgi:hypothetical protein
MTNESEEILWEMAEQAWSECWPEEPELDYIVSASRASDTEIHWLLEVFENLISEYDGPLSDIADLLGDFSDKWIEKRIQAIREDAREAEAQALADAAECTRFDPTEYP